MSNEPQDQLERSADQKKPTSAQLVSEDYLALGLGLVFPGAGHPVVGQSEKGIGVIVGTIVLAVVIFIFGTLTCGIGYIAFLVLPLIYFLAIADLWMCISTRKHRELDMLEIFPTASPRTVRGHGDPRVEHVPESVDQDVENPDIW